MKTFFEDYDKLRKGHCIEDKFISAVGAALGFLNLSLTADHRHAGIVSRRMPQGELRLIKGAGHNLHHHHPVQVLDAVRDVRERLTKGANPVEITGAAG